MLQGVVLFFGSIVFLIIQRTELGGLARAYSYWSNPGNAARASVRAMQYVPAKVNIVAYFDFVFKTTVAATMFPHLTARLFAAQNAKVIQRGMACMVFTFFVVQFSSMVTGWVAIDTLRSLPRGASAFGELLKVSMRMSEPCLYTLSCTILLHGLLYCAKGAAGALRPMHDRPRTPRCVLQPTGVNRPCAWCRWEGA